MSDRTETEIMDLVRAIDVRAPQELHRSVRAMADQRSAGRRRRPLVLAVPAAAALAAVIAALLASAGPARPPALDAGAAARPALSASTGPAPGEQANHLDVAVDGLVFPYWGAGWAAVGTRRDRLAGRDVTTVLYRDRAGRTVGYAIIAGTPAPQLGGGRELTAGGVRFREFSAGSATVLTWIRHGHLCVIAGRGVGAATLSALARTA